jgi:hypothetical protein
MTGHSRGRRGNWLRAAFVISLAIAVHALGGGSAQAAPVGSGSGSLSGVTSQGYPVLFKISSNGQMLMLGKITLDVKCTSGTEIAEPDAFSRVPIKAGGGLHVTLVAPPTPGPNGTSYTGKDTLTAKLNRERSKLTGTWRLRVDVSFPGGQRVRCDSGLVRFAATA